MERRGAPRDPSAPTLRRVLCGAFVMLACGPADAPPPPPASGVLGDGTTVDVGSDGSIALLTADGHALLGLAARAPLARRYGRREVEAQGSYTFRRIGETEHAATRFLGAEVTAAAAVLRYAGADASATLTVSPGPRARTTLLRLEMTPTDSAPFESLAIPLACDGDASFLGFGAQYDRVDHRAEAFPLWVEEQGIGRTGALDEHTTYFAMPYWLDLRGTGALARTSARTLVDLCASDVDVAWIEVETGAPLEVLVFHGPEPLDVIAELGDEVGRPSRPPDWAFSAWVGVQGGRDALLAAETRLRTFSVPFSALWAQDWSGRREFATGRFGVQYRWVADDVLYPDLAGLIADLHGRGTRFLGYANPFVIEGLDHHAEMAAEGLLLRDETGAPYDMSIIELHGSMPDFTRPETYAYVEGFLGAMTEDLGMDGWMADFGEWQPLDAALADGSDPRRSHNLYPAAWHRASREALDAAHPDGDYVMFSRSGWTGSHDVVQIVWIGDQEQNWEATDGLPTVIPALLSLGASGIPFVTHDVAGFSGGPSTEELWLRWCELGALTPFLRTHEGARRDENWDWDTDDATTEHFRRMSALHEALRPEWTALADEAARSGAPILRSLALVSPADLDARAVTDEFLIGEDLLAAPVVTEAATMREVYLPAGTWFFVWTGERFDGPSRVTVPAPIGEPPLFARDVDRPDLRALGLP